MAKKIVTPLIVIGILLAALLPVWPGSPASRAQAQTGVTWNVDYYDNPYLMGNAVVTRQESAMAFNWGGGSPVGGVGVDGFSVRFAADVRFQPGTYRFYILADDGVQVFTGATASWNQPVIDTYDRPRPGELLTADVDYPVGGLQKVLINYREDVGDAYIYMAWESLSDGVTGPDFPTPVSTTGSWWTEYFSNSVLVGAPIAARTESSPSQHWGTGAPTGGVPADNFAVRFSTVRYFDAGTYIVSVRADDGVRVNANGVWIINEWHSATGQAYTGSFTVSSGQYPIVIEYYEATGDAYLDVSMMKRSSPGTPPTTTTATAMVNAYALNVRDAPDPDTGVVIGKVARGETYPVIGRNTDSTWWQIAFSGTTGWVSGRYVTVQNAHTVQVTSGAPVPTPVPTIPPYIYGQCPGFLPSRLAVGGWGRVTPGLANNLRALPSTVSQWLGQIPAGGVFEVIGGPICSENTAWWQVRYYGFMGWTSEGQSGTYWLEPYNG